MARRARAPRRFRTVRITNAIPDRDHFGLLLNAMNLRGHAVEVGTHLGLFAEQLLERWEGTCLHLVDPWQTAMPDYQDDIAVMGDREPHYRAAMTRLERFAGRFQVHRQTSLEAAPTFDDSSLDFVYIDGNHAYEHVRQDIGAWWPKVKSGGILAGHDWGGEWRRNVRRAVLELACPLGLRVWRVGCPISYFSWYIEKP